MRTSTTKSGVVVNCLWAPVHKYPRNDSEIICELNALSEIVVDPKSSIGDFYYVHVPSGDEGYCLKEYVAVRR